jgi:uracil-DNA glycosylase family 4
MSDRKHPLAKCEECPLRERGRYVPTKFPNTTDGKATIAFIGEAPATNEVAKQEPFVGPSGKLLDAVLDHYQVRRDQVLLGNAAACMYPKSMGELPIAAIEACRPRLLDELKTADPRTVVAMGNSAIKGVLPADEAKRGVNKLRVGPPRRSPILNRPVVSTFHPAACLRNQGNFPSLVTDVGKALAIDPPTAWYEPNTVIVTQTDFFDVVNKIMILNRGEGVVVDTESGNEKDSSYGNVHLENLLCIGVGPLDPSNQDTVYVFTDELLELPGKKDFLARMLQTCGVIAHNGKYDIGVLQAALDIELPLVFDTMLAHYAIDERSGLHGLKYLATEFLGCPDYEAEIKPYIVGGNYATIPRETLYKYNAFDVHATRLLYSYFSEEINSRGLTRILAHLHRSSNTLTRIESRGIGFDQDYSDRIEERLLAEQQRVEESIPFNPRSHIQVKKYFNEMGIILPNTQEETLELVKTKIPETHLARVMIERILTARGYTKMLSTYVTGLQEKVTANGTVHPSFLLHGTTTGRLSSRNPNAQNIPRAKELKRQFIPSVPENVFVQVDFSQAELRVITWLAREENTREIFNDPTRDIFDELCAQMFPGFEDLDPSDPSRKEIRVLVKKFAYGILYGRGAAAIAREQKIDIAKAQEYHKVFKDMVPEIVKYQESIIEKVDRGEDLINPFGRHRRFYLITDQNKSSVHNEAMSYMPQSTASDICVEAANRLTDLGVDIRNLIHDAILAEAPAGDAEEVANLISRVMREVGEEVTEGYVNFDTDAKIGTSWDQV